MCAMRAGSGRKRAAFGYAAGVTLAVVAWGYLVKMAIDFGTRARDGDSGSWAFLGLAALGAMACLFFGLMMVSRFLDEVRGGTADPALEDTRPLPLTPAWPGEPTHSPAPPAPTMVSAAAEPSPSTGGAAPATAWTTPEPLQEEPMEPTQPPPTLSTATTPRASQLAAEPEHRRLADADPLSAPGTRAAEVAVAPEPGRRAERPDPASPHATLPPEPTARGKHAASGPVPPQPGPRPVGGKRAKR